MTASLSVAIADLVKVALNLGQTPTSTGTTYTPATTVLARLPIASLLVGDVSRCETCRALVLNADQTAHTQWHTDIALAAARSLYGTGTYSVATKEQLAAGK